MRRHPVGWIAAATTALLVAVSGRYGYHRDELYFLACGRHLAWGYPDQPPFVPFVARVMSWIAPHSLVLLRLPSALAVGAVVLLTGGIARELGGDRSAQALAAAVVAIAGFVLGSGHLLSTSTFDLLASAGMLRLVLPIARDGRHGRWPIVGLVAGLGLLDNDLLALFALALFVGLLLVGPRDPVRSPWLWLGVLIAAALWSPYLVWQAQHGWPELTVARDIANGGSGTSTPRALVLPMQLLLFGPPLAPVWLAGLWRFARAADLRWARFVAVGYVVLLVEVVVSGGKGYYLAGFYPALIAAGAVPTLRWLRAHRRRRWALAAGFALTTPVLPIVLPLVPVGDLHNTSVVSANYDAGETVGWPAFVREIDAVDSAHVLVASNYGEAGAVQRYSNRYAVYSGHNGFYYWGPPTGPAAEFVAVGFDRGFLAPLCARLTHVAQLDNRVQVSDDEQGAPVWLCTPSFTSWRAVWPRFRALG